MKETLYIAHPDRYTTGVGYRRCGQSGILLPKISLGMWHNFGHTHSVETARNILFHAFNNGITHFDLANNYGPPPGTAELFFGQMMKGSFAPYRDEMFIATKAGYDMWEGPYGSWGSRKHLISSLNQSLQRMNLDYVDLFYSHRYDPNTPLEETLQTLVDIVRSGKALYVGISRWPREATEFAFQYLRESKVPALIYQGRFNLLDRAPKQEGILEAAHKAGSGFISFSPLAQGLLSNRYLNGIPEGSRMTEERFLKSEMLTPSILYKIKQLNKLAEERGETLAGMALAWILHHPEVTSVLVGVSSPEQLTLNLKATQAAPFSTEELQRIEQIMAQQAETNTPHTLM